MNKSPSTTVGVVIGVRPVVVTSIKSKPFFKIKNNALPKLHVQITKNEEDYT
jgi:hypothetical protein